MEYDTKIEYEELLDEAYTTIDTLVAMLDTEKFTNRTVTTGGNVNHGKESRVTFCPYCGKSYLSQKGSVPPEPEHGFLATNLDKKTILQLLDGAKAMVSIGTSMEEKLRNNSSHSCQLYRHVSLTVKAFLNDIQQLVAALKNKIPTNRYERD